MEGVELDIERQASFCLLHRNVGKHGLDAFFFFFFKPCSSVSVVLFYLVKMNLPLHVLKALSYLL